MISNSGAWSRIVNPTIGIPNTAMCDQRWASGPTNPEISGLILLYPTEFDVLFSNQFAKLVHQRSHRVIHHPFRCSMAEKESCYFFVALNGVVLQGFKEQKC